MTTWDKSRLRERLLSSIRVNAEVAGLIDKLESKVEEAMKNLKKIGNESVQEQLSDEREIIQALQRQALANGYAVRMAIKAGEQPASIDALLDQFDASNAQLKAALEKLNARLDQFLGS
jgi:hypothetical protein